jgi:glycosyltransferase involved in cell wall biosynthesis
MRTQPLVSVIIACKNNQEYIAQSLESVKNQTYTNWELIIVDNFSTDGTFEIAKQYTDQVYQLGPERSTQFNYGFTKSKGELIYRIGAEFRLEPDVIQKCVDKIADGYDALAIHNRSVGDSIWAQVRYLERESYKNDDTVVAVRFFKREVFATVNGFDENLVANEDFDLHNRIVDAGYKWSHVDATEDHLGEPKNLGEVWNKFYYYGKTMGNYMSKYKNHRKHVRLLRPSYRIFYKELLKSPKLFIAFWIYMATKMLAGVSGYTITKIKNWKTQVIQKVSLKSAKMH